MDVLWYAWEIFTDLETNAWWLMMVVYTLTCITFIWTNSKIRESIRNIDDTIRDILNEYVKENQ
jgi:hypothetical protein